LLDIKSQSKKLESGDKVEQHPINNIMKTTMENIKEMIDVNTIVGDAVETSDGTVIIPISKVSFGFVSGGGEYKEQIQNGKSKENDTESENLFPFAGGTGAGVSVNPMAFLVVGQGQVKLLPVHFNTPYDRIVEMVPEVLNEIQNYLNKGKDENRLITHKKQENMKQ